MIILTDIEGTTSSISFVKDRMFPYSYEHIESFVRNKKAEPDIRALLVKFKSEWQQDTGEELGESIDLTISALKRCIQEDKKITALKSFQGMIWKEAFENGSFKAHIYSDTFEWLKIQQLNSVPVYVYSSGSVQAQLLYFGYSEFGDLREYFQGHFDTEVGSKKDAASYVKIASQIGVPLSEIVFVSDVAAELEAAAIAGMRVVWMVRPDNNQLLPQEYEQSVFPVAHNFSEFENAIKQTGVVV